MRLCHQAAHPTLSLSAVSLRARSEVRCRCVGSGVALRGSEWRSPACAEPLRRPGGVSFAVWRASVHLCSGLCPWGCECACKLCRAAGIRPRQGARHRPRGRRPREGPSCPRGGVARAARIIWHVSFCNAACPQLPPCQTLTQNTRQRTLSYEVSVETRWDHEL